MKLRLSDRFCRQFSFSIALRYKFQVAIAARPAIDLVGANIDEAILAASALVRIIVLCFCQTFAGKPRRPRMMFSILSWSSGFMILSLIF